MKTHKNCEVVFIGLWNSASGLIRRTNMQLIPMLLQRGIMSDPTMIFTTSPGNLQIKMNVFSASSEVTTACRKVTATAQQSLVTQKNVNRPSRLEVKHHVLRIGWQHTISLFIYLFFSQSRSTPQSIPLHEKSLQIDRKRTHKQVKHEQRGLKMFIYQSIAFVT